MPSLLNLGRPPVFCPGCSHERMVHALDRALDLLEMEGSGVAIVSDIGCSGLFDTYYNTHAMHGLHGRGLTYAAGLKLARPELTVIVTMGDGGLGIGAAHLLAACRRNLDLTLLVLNNFNFGMTGGQYSATTPADADLGAGFQHRLEKPMDVCQTAATAGASYVARCSSFHDDLPDQIARAIRHNGFAVLDAWGVCPGRYGRHNRITPKSIDESLRRLPPADGVVEGNQREEFGTNYRAQRQALAEPAPPKTMEPHHPPACRERQSIVLMGSAGQRVVTAGELLCWAGLSAGLRATQKNEHNITVLRGPSISEVILSEEPVGYMGIEAPDVVLAIDAEGVQRRAACFADLPPSALVLRAAGIEVPATAAEVRTVDLKALRIPTRDWALAALGALAALQRVISPPMLLSALELRFEGQALERARGVLDAVWSVGDLEG